MRVHATLRTSDGRDLEVGHGNAPDDLWTLSGGSVVGATGAESCTASGCC